MECIKCLLEDENIQGYLNEKEESIIGGAEAFHQFPETVKEYVMENLESFIGEDLNETYENIISFTETAAFQYLNDIVSAIAD